MQRPTPSAVTTVISSNPERASPPCALAFEIAHNLEHQHQWTSIRIHEPYSLSPLQPMPLLTGIPPNTVYTHPDEQAYILEHSISMGDVPLEREWVIPTSQGQKWSLSRLAGVFDSLLTIAEDELELDRHEQQANKTLQDFLRLKREKPWGGKRALLAMVNRGMGGDGTIVYYVVLEGAVKPRQN
ncbi:hypothetical protein FQN57_006448 [Myotisia sp. PD_48]|nr:hypothetical protein FQN57_006448 [Myotisia sp. PD_48]